MILTVCMSPSTDVTIELDALNVGKTNVVKSKTLTFGGKALNVAIGVARLGGDVHATGIMYTENGAAFENLLKAEGVPYSFAWNPGRVRENYKFIDNRSMLTEVNDVSGEVSEAKAQEVLDKVSELSKQSKVVVFSGGLPKGIDEEYYGKLVRAADDKTIKIADASGMRMLHAVEAGVDLVKPNLEELENILGKCISDKQDMLHACYELIARGAKRVLLSLGKQGAVITDGAKNFYCKSINVAVNSTVGAGDGMVAAAAMTLEKGGCLQEVLRAGVAAGTATVMTTGQTSFTKEKYREVFDSLQIYQI